MRTPHHAGLSIALAAALLVGSSAAYAALTTEKCLAKKLGAQGNLQKCRVTADARALLGKPANLAKCFTKFQEMVAQLNEKAGDAGIQCRYRDNGNGTVTDYDTGLQWEKKGGVGGGQNLVNPHDVDNLYDWSTSGTVPDGPAFTDFLNRLNNCSIPSVVGFSSTGFAGHCDWRLPQLEELRTILLEPCGTSPCIDPIFGPTAADIHWTSTTNASNTANAWTLAFDDGNVTFIGKIFNFPVRAVRGGL